jgi:toxin ParE1/3/4
VGKVIWSPASLQDVDAIAEYIAKDSADQASLFVIRLVQATDRLGAFPRSGRVIPEIGKDVCREVICGSYRIMYRIVGDEAWITGVVHGARDWFRR